VYEKYQCIPKLSLLVKPIVKRNQRADIMMINGQKLKRLTGSITMFYSWAVHCCLLNARNWWSFSRQSCTKVMAGTKENLHNSAYILGDLPFPPNSGIVKTSKLPVMCCFVFFFKSFADFNLCWFQVSHETLICINSAGPQMSIAGWLDGKLAPWSYGCQFQDLT